MKLREIIEAIQKRENLNKCEAIKEILKPINQHWDGGEIGYYTPDTLDKYVLDTYYLSEIESFKLKNKFERRLIKLAEVMQ